MRSGILQGLGLNRQWLARCLAAVLLLPLLLGLIPQTAISAEAALERDLAWSVCEHDAGTPTDGKGHEQKHDTQCILCVAGCPICAPALTADLPATSQFPSDLSGAAPPPEGKTLTTLRVLRDGSPTRGPPVA